MVFEIQRVNKSFLWTNWTPAPPHRTLASFWSVTPLKHIICQSACLSVCFSRIEKVYNIYFTKVNKYISTNRSMDFCCSIIHKDEKRGDGSDPEHLIWLIYNTLEECQNLRMETSTIIVYRSRYALDFAKRKRLGEGAVSRGVARN